MRALDPRLLHRTRSARPLLAVDAAARLATALAVLAQASLLALIVAEAFAGAPLQRARDGVRPARDRVRGAGGGGMGDGGHGPPGRVERSVGASPGARRAAPARAADGGRRRGRRRARRGGRGRHRGPRGLLRALPASGRAGLGRPVAGDRLGRVRRPAGRADHAAHAAAGAGVHVAHRPLHRGSARASAGRRCGSLSTHFLDVVRGLPTLRAFGRAEDQADGDRRGRRALSRRDDGDAARQLPVGVRARAGGHARRRARRRDDRRAARGRQPRAAGRPDRDRPRARAVPAVPPPGRGVPRERGRARGRRADVRAARRAGRRRDRAARGSRRARRGPPSGSSRCRSRTPPGPDWCSTGWTSSSRPGRRSRWSARAGPARAPSPRCCSACSSPPAGASASAASTCGSCRIDAWRRQIAWVPQHPTLLRGTVADNIRLGDPSASERLVREAAARAGADAFIRALPDGYATVVGDGARSLSPGERRRIGLARAFLATPRS